MTHQNQNLTLGTACREPQPLILHPTQDQVQILDGLPVHALEEVVDDHQRAGAAPECTDGDVGKASAGDCGDAQGCCRSAGFSGTVQRPTADRRLKEQRCEDAAHQRGGMRHEGKVQGCALLCQRASDLSFVLVGQHLEGAEIIGPGGMVGGVAGTGGGAG